MKGFVVALLVLLAGLAAWAYFTTSNAAPPAEMTEAERVQIEAEVRQELINRMEEYEAVAMSGDVEGFVSFLTSDARLLMPGMTVTKENIQGIAADFLSTTTITSMNADLLELFVEGDAAYGIYEFLETLQVEGQEPATETSNCFTRWEKEDGVWKFDREVCGPRDAPPEG